MKLRSVFVSAALATSLSACGGGRARVDIFSGDRAGDASSLAESFWPRFEAVPIPRGANLAIGIVDEGVIGVSLPDGERWLFEHELDSRPVITGNVVVGMGAGELFALNAHNGELLWSRKASGALRGAGDNGRATVVSLASRGEHISTVLIVSHDGRVLRQLEAASAVGVPAIVGNFAFFPWEGRKLTIYDISQGSEIARVALPEPASAAFTLDETLFLGGIGAFRFDAQFFEEPRLSYVSPPERSLPEAPRWFANGYESLPSIADMGDSHRLYARPRAKGPFAIQGGYLVASYRNLTMGLSAEGGATQWVRLMPEKILGGAAYIGGSALCDAAGEVSFLDQKTGAIAGSVSLGRRPKACVVQADDLSFPAAASDSSVFEQLALAIKVREPELLPIQEELLRELTDLADEPVTQALIDIASSSNIDEALLSRARTALSRRRNGASYMFEALDYHYNYLEEAQRPPPVGPLADALAAMYAVEAAPLLAEHLLDPANSSLDIEHVAAALVTLAGPTQLPQLRSFFALYRATADDEPLIRAVAYVARAIVDIAGAEGQALIAKSMKDPTTLPEIKELIGVLLDDDWADAG